MLLKYWPIIAAVIGAALTVGMLMQEVHDDHLRIQQLEDITIYYHGGLTH